MRKNSGHRLKFTDAVAPTLESAWFYSPQRHEWDFVIYSSKEGFHCLNVFGQEFVTTESVEIEAISPVKVPGTTPANYLERLAYARAEAGWTY